MTVTFKDFDGEAYNACFAMYPEQAKKEDFITVHEGEVIDKFTSNEKRKFLVVDSITNNIVEVYADRCTIVK